MGMSSDRVVRTWDGKEPDLFWGEILSPFLRCGGHQWLTQGFLQHIGRISEELWAGGYLHTSDPIGKDRSDGLTFQITGSHSRDVYQKAGGRSDFIGRAEDLILQANHCVAEGPRLLMDDRNAGPGKWGERPMGRSFVVSRNSSLRRAPMIIRPTLRPLSGARRLFSESLLVPEHILPRRGARRAAKRAVGKAHKKKGHAGEILALAIMPAF